MVGKGVKRRGSVGAMIETCSTLQRSYAADSSMDLAGVAALSWMRLIVVLLNSLSRLV